MLPLDFEQEVERGAGWPGQTRFLQLPTLPTLSLSHFDISQSYEVIFFVPFYS